ncbi:Malectin [Gracilaria domingensis]|nr:Malectin [Gracilaria domingensis]
MPTDAIVPATPELSFVATQVDVNCGGPAVGRFAEEDFAWIRGSTSFFGGPEGVVIGGAEEQNTPALISHRYGLDGSEWGYTIPVDTPGTYDCSLHFAETDAASFTVGARVFDVTVNGVTIADLDVFAETGQAEFTAVVKTFADLTITESIIIDLKPKVGDAFIAAITCAKTADLPNAIEPQASTTPDAVGPKQTVSPPAMGRETLDGESDEFITPDATQPQILVPQGNDEVDDSEAAPTEDDVTEPQILVPQGEDSDSEAAPTEDETTETETPDGESSDDSETASGVPPVATVTPAPGEPDETDVPAESPQPEASTQVRPEDNAASSPEPSPQVEPTPSTSPEATTDSLESLIEPPLQANGSGLLITYTLEVTVANGNPLTREITDAIKRVGSEGITGDVDWRVTDIREGATNTRQSNPDSEYIMDLQVLYEEDQDQERSQEQFMRFVDDEDMNQQLRAEGFGDVTVSLVGETPGEVASETASLSQTSTIVGVIVGCVLFLMVMVAIVAFYVMRRNRSEGDDFDAPPPTMTESEMSSVVERTETAASIEYLDDDSTFTAATSRAGEHPDQMAYVKDAFGRGTDGAHGTTSL